MTATADDLLFHSPALLFVADPGGSVRALSGALERLFGPAVQKGTKLAEAVHPDSRHAFDETWAKLGDGPDPIRLGIRIRRADGSYGWVSCLLRRSSTSGEVHGMLQEPDPVSAQIQEEARILRIIQDNVPLVVWATDGDSIYTHHAGKGLATAGLRQGQFVGMNALELYSSNGEAVAAVRRALAGQVAHLFDASHASFWETWVIPAHDDRGQVTGVVGFSQDLTETKRAEKELTEKLALVERQRQVIDALSTPIIEVWDKVLTLPLVGLIDSARAAAVMDNLLREVSRKGARFAILDVTGVEAVDTSTANHLLKLIQALRLLGAEGIITGIQPSVAQTMVALGVDMDRIVTLANLRDSLRHCIARMREAAAQSQGPNGSAAPGGARSPA